MKENQAMLKLTLRNLSCHKARTALTTFGVMLAVGFVVSAFVLGDGLRASFDQVSDDITAGVDLQVTHSEDLGETPPLPDGAVAEIAAIDGVDAAVADVEAADDAVRPHTPGGAGITTDGPPQLAFNWIDDEGLNPFSLVDGSAPRRDEFTIDVDSAEKHGFVVGDTYEVETPGGTVPLRLSGTSSFGPDNATLGAVLMQVDTSQAGELFGIDGVTAVKVRLSPGAAIQEVAEAIRRTLPEAEVIDRAALAGQTSADFTDEIDVVGNILLGFGIVALFVSAFMIYNTFAIVVGQRTRELALLRSLGAGTGQVRSSVMAEAVLVGLVASAGGIALGMGFAAGLEAMFAAGGATLPPHPTILAARTIASAVAAGVGVTLLAAFGPARRAAVTPPISALSGNPPQGGPVGARRTVAACVLLATGVLAGAAGLLGAGPTAANAASIAGGALGIFLGVVLLSPLAVGAVTSILGWPIGWVTGVAGRMAQRNAARNPQRTSTTAAALMIGLALVTTALVVGESVKSTLSSIYVDTARADYYLSDQLEEVRFPADLADELLRSDAVAAASGFTYLDARVEGTATEVVGTDFDQVEGLLDLGVEDGWRETAVVNPVVVSHDEAASRGVKVGDRMNLELPAGTPIETTVAALFENQAVVTQDFLLDRSVLDAAGVAEAPDWVAFSLVGDAPDSAVDSLVDGLTQRFPYAEVETASGFGERSRKIVDDILAMVDVMVGLALVIAIFGIANTQALSVFERTRELGLVRAVGMSRRQLRRTVRLEAAMVAGFGAVVGVGLGWVFSLGAVGAMPDSFASQLDVPGASIARVVAITVLAAVVAAWLPARRAGRLDVLGAIASQS